MIEEAFKRLFGDMYLSDSKTAKQIFEYGYKAGAAAERAACAKVCDDKERANLYGVKECAAAIRERMK